LKTKTVIKQVELGLGRHAPAGGITCRQLWLLQAPPGVNGMLWQVIALSALNVMESGRKWLIKLRMPAIEAARQQRGQHTAAGTPVEPESPVTHEQLQTVCAGITERFWSLIDNFTALHSVNAPSVWVKQLSKGNDQPFIELKQRLSTDDGRQHECWYLAVRCRPALPPLPDALL
jgi:hypothetical protein